MFIIPFCFSASCRVCFLCASLFALYRWPRLLLHGWQAGTIVVWSPPRSISMRWSAVVAGAVPHQWHRGLLASSALRALRYSASFVVCCLGICSRASLVLARRLRALPTVWGVGCCCRVHVCSFVCLLSVCYVTACLKVV